MFHDNLSDDMLSTDDGGVFIFWPLDLCNKFIVLSDPANIICFTKSRITTILRYPGSFKFMHRSGAIGHGTRGSDDFLIGFDDSDFDAFFCDHEGDDEPYWTGSH